MTIWDTLQTNASESIASGLVAAGASYFILKRQESIDFFGLTDLAEWQLDGILIAAESAWGDIMGEWVIPAVQEKIHPSEGLSNFIEKAGPPAITGAEHAAIKVYGYNSENTLTHEFLLGAGSKIGGNFVVSMF